MKRMACLIILVVLMAGSVFGQAGAPNPADTTLRLWLKADDLGATHNPGDAVNSWVDASSYGTIFGPDPAWSEAPHYAEVVINPPTVSAVVRFEAAGDSQVPGTRDRLWQKNNLAPSFDPLNMGVNQAMTVVVVYSNSAADGAVGPYNPLVTKRGTNSCVWMFGDVNNGSTAQLYYVTYSDPLVYYAGTPYVVTNRWNVSAMTISGSNIINFYQDGDENAVVELVLTSGSPQAIIGRNASTPEPAGIACHSQACCGRGETFAGDIAEIIVYSRELGSSEWSALAGYLSEKYFVGEVEQDPENPVNPRDVDYRPAFCGDQGTVVDLGDLTADCYVNLADFAPFATQWQTDSGETRSDWSYAGDFSVGSGNPNLPWSYGYYDGSGNFTLYNQLGTPPSPLINWTYNGNPDVRGNANKNTDQNNAYVRTDWGPGMGWRPGQCCIMTPITELTFRPAGRFTAPVAGSYNVAITFENRVATTGEPTGVFVRVNGSEVFNPTVTGYESGPENYASYSNTVALSAGQTITFGVYALTGQGLSYDGGVHQVGVEALISGPPVPLPCGGAGTEYTQADLNLDCQVDIRDFALFSETWLRCTDPVLPACGSFEEVADRRAADEARLWIESKFTGEDITPPISFLYGGLSSANLLPAWNFQRTQQELDANRTKWVLTWTDPTSGLAVKCRAIEFYDYPAVKWVVYFQNTGVADTAILSDVQAADYWLNSRMTGDFVLLHARGSRAEAIDFEPLETQLGPGASIALAPYAGRSSDTTLPFFTISNPDNTGAIIAVGWSGQWAASFTRDSGQNVKVRAGMELTHLKLHPGETIRTPAMMQLFWAGNRIHGQNQFRRLLLDHWSPRPAGPLVDPPVAASVHATYCFECTSQANMVPFVNTTADHGFPVDYIWIDAGWYNLNGTTSWVNVGTWEADPVRYPNGMKPVADAAHNRGYKFLLWFEPERVTNGSWLMNNHPDWVFLQGNDWPLLNLGNPDALAWAKNHFSTMINQIGVDCYRHDFNVFPLSAWRTGEAADRQGMNEIRHIMGLYEYFDYLQAQHPNLVIDNCASGGRRIDFEMLRRALTLTRTDYLWYTESAQAMQYALSLWVPLTGLGSVSYSPYDFRSGAGSHFVTAFNHNDAGMWAPAIARVNELNAIRHLYRGDFYPLTGYTQGDNVWIAWQYDSPEIGEGLVEAFRRANSVTTSSMIFKLSGLDPSATYTIDDLDTPGTITRSGSELMNTGLLVNIPSEPGSALITYVKN